MIFAQVVTDLKRLSLVVAAVMILDACAYADPDTTYPIPTSEQRQARRGGYTGTDKTFEDLYGSTTGGINILGGGGDKPAAGDGGGIGVNGFLWRASLDTISFMPLASADPFGGVIITDWYSPPETQEERFKITVYILGRDLRADGIRAAVFRQRQDVGGAWIDASVEQRTAVDLENAILKRARQLRIAGLQ